MGTINSIAQARTAKAGTHGVKGKTAPAGISLKKESDALGAGGFNLRFRRGNRRPTMGLGPVNAFKNLEEVFEAARDALKLVSKGIDPIAARKREKDTNLAAVSFKQATEAYYEDLAPTLKHKYGGPCWINPVRKWAYPVLGQTLLDDITPRLVAAVVRAAAAKGNLETGRRVQQRIRAILNAATVNGQRDDLRRNPADAELVKVIVRALKREAGDRPHFRRIEDIADAPARFRSLLAARDSAAGLRADELDAWTLMVTGTLRPSETLLTRYGEVDLNKKRLVKSAATMKSKREHIVPLSSIALEVLERRDRVRLRTGDEKVDAAAFVFAGESGRALNYTLFALAPKRAGVEGVGSPHSWRSVFRDWAATIGRVDGDLAELALAHALDPTKRAYFRDTAPEPRRAIMEAYARWLMDDRAGVIAFPTGSRA
jgi:integrase